MNILVKKSISLCLLVALTVTPISAFAQTTMEKMPVNNTATTMQIYKTPYGNVEVGPNGAITWTYKAFKAALRSGGWLLGEAIKLFSTKAGNWVRNNSMKLADLMDKAYNWSEGVLTDAIIKLGAPDDVARELAKFILGSTKI